MLIFKECNRSTQAASTVGALELIGVFLLSLQSSYQAIRQGRGGRLTCHGNVALLSDHRRSAGPPLGCIVSTFVAFTGSRMVAYIEASAAVPTTLSAACLERSTGAAGVWNLVTRRIAASSGAVTTSRSLDNGIALLRQPSS